MHSRFDSARRHRAYVFAILLLGFHSRAPAAGLTISGPPPGTAVVGQLYSFTPSVWGDDSRNESFAIANKPAWLAFDKYTGTLSGTPAADDVGTYSNIVISVRVWKDKAYLPAFAITVEPSQAASSAPSYSDLTISPASPGSATVSWQAPTQNEDGSALTDLAGFRVLYGTSPTALDQTIELPGAASTSVHIEELTPGTYYFAVKAYTTSAQESAASQLAWKTIQ